jgi:nitronate monooxygenase
MIKTWINETFQTRYPIILAPMFLVSNEKMMVAANKAGITGCLPAHNYKTIEEFTAVLASLHKNGVTNFGINLIVNKSNILMEKQLKACLEYKPAYIITSLGGPERVIKECKAAGIKVLCDVVDQFYAHKVQEQGADAVIAVNSGAGGHAGNIAPSILIPMLKRSLTIPVISAGGVGTGSGLLSVLALGADGVSIGSPFIATKECDVSQPYKEAIIKYGAKDIVMTDKVSGSMCTVINTDYVKKIGTKQNFVEHFLNTNKKIKKYAKMLTYYKGMKLLEKAAFSASYQTVWCAGPSIEFIHKEETVEEIVMRLATEYDLAKADFLKKVSL